MKQYCIMVTKKKQFCIISSTNKGDYAHFLIGYLSEQRMIARVQVDNFKIKIIYLNIKFTNIQN